MARGVKRSTEELIAEIDGKIEGFQSKINELKAQRKELVEADRQVKLQKVLDAADEKGLSIEDILQRISE